MWSRDWTADMYRSHPWSALKKSVRYYVARYFLAGPRPSSCRCGSPVVYLYSRSGKCLDDPLDYHYECRKCRQGPKPIKYPGRPKGSRNKNTIAKEKSQTSWEKMCADAEKELYG